MALYIEDEYKTSLIDEIFKDIPTKKELLLIDALLFAVYGWTPEKIKKIRIDSLSRWVQLAKKRITWGDVYKLQSLLEPKKKSLWQKIKLKKPLWKN
jgi:hypothetical protein